MKKNYKNLNDLVLYTDILIKVSDRIFMQNLLQIVHNFAHTKKIKTIIIIIKTFTSIKGVTLFTEILFIEII